MFVDLIDMIISDKAKYSCETRNQQDLSCRACDITPDQTTVTQKSSTPNELIENANHTTKGISPLVGEMFGYLHT